MKRLIILVGLCIWGCAGKESTEILILGAETEEVIPGKTLRVFAISHKQRVESAENEETYYQKMRKMMEAINDEFTKNYPNLVVFPEDTGLVLAFFGMRGNEGRKETSAVSAFLSLLTQYSEPIRYYAEKYDVSIRRKLFLALTDSLWRPFFNTFSRLAREYGAYIISCTNVAEVEESFDESLFFLKDPVVQSDNVYVAKGPDVWNTCFLFSPEGKIVYRIKKVHLVPEEVNMLDLSYGSVEEAEIYRIPRTEIDICIAVCADAFYEDYVRKMDERGCDIIIQPSANPGMWAYYYPYWQPEDWLRSTMWTMQGFNIQYNVNPMMTGNFFDMVFDGQGAITAKRDPRIRRDINYIGNNPLSPDYDNLYPEGGFLLLSPWVIDDPGKENPSLSKEERRDLLKKKSISLLSPSACEGMKINSPDCGRNENLYQESILWADLVLR